MFAMFDENPGMALILALAAKYGKNGPLTDEELDWLLKPQETWPDGLRETYRELMAF